MSRRLMFVVNVDWFFLSHRLPIALAACNEGYEVHVACGDTGRCADIEARGLIVHRLSLARGRAGLFSSLSSFFEIFSLFRQVRPVVVHLVTIKPVLFGGVAARLIGIKCVVAAISGLGFIFVGNGFMAFLRQMIVGLAYRLALGKKNLKVIFQNPDDRDTLCRWANISESKIVMIRGSGVDLDKFRARRLPEGMPVVVLAARLLRDKGVLEFVEAAALLQARGYRARFCLVGEIDPDNPASLTPADIRRLGDQGKVELWGQRQDMPEVLATASIVVLPSYREGLPKVLLEAAACGRAVIATNVPGCRDAIEPGINGMLVPPRDPMALSSSIGMLLDDSELLASMGRGGRTLAEREFDVVQVVRMHLDIYRELEATA